MKQTILLLCIAIALSSCGNLKRTTNKNEHTSSVDSSGTSTELITTVSTIDTLITLPPDTIEGARPLQELIDESVLVFEDTDQKLELTYDKPSKTIKARATSKAKVVPVSKTEITTAQRSEEVTTQRKEEQVKVDEYVKRTQLPWWIWLFPIIAIIFVLFYFRMRIWL